MTDGENYFWLRIPASRIDALLASGPAVFPEVEAAEGAARLLSIHLWESLNTRSSDPWATWHYGEGGFDPDQPGVSSITERGQPF
jgi:hypothetical protein